VTNLQSETSDLVVITGGANGIGRATVKQFAELDTKLIVVLDTDEKQLQSLTNDCEMGTGLFLPIVCDVTLPNSLAEAANSVISLIEKHKLKINCVTLISLAGRALKKEFNKDIFPTPEIFGDSVQLNLNSHYYFLHAFLDIIQTSKGPSKIVLVSTINALVSADLVAYSSAKSGLRGLAVSLARPLFKNYNTTINVAILGTVRPEDSERKEPKNMEELDKSTFSGQVLTEKEAASSIIWISRAPSGLIGREVVLDLGQSLNMVQYVE